MTNDTTTDHAAYYTAIKADDEWQVELDRLKIERYSLAAKGIEGSELRRLYERKLAADRENVDAIRGTRSR